MCKQVNPLFSNGYLVHTLYKLPWYVHCKYNELAHNATTDDYKILNDAVRIRPKSLHEGNNYQTGIRTAGADHFFQHCTTRGIEKPVL